MEKKLLVFLILFNILLLFNCPINNNSSSSSNNNLADPLVTDETEALYSNLKNINMSGMLIGVQDTETGDDMYNVTGSYPAIIGLDLATIAGDWWTTEELLQYREDQMALWTPVYIDYIKEIRRRGAIITLSWHQSNPIPINPEASPDQRYYPPYNEGPHELWRIVPPDAINSLHQQFPAISNWGDYHDVYHDRLELVVNFLKQLVDDSGNPIPIIYRPFHENNGNWFWWGAGTDQVPPAADSLIYYNNPGLYKAVLNSIWKFTIDYFNQNGVHNLLYAISPNKMWGSSLSPSIGIAGASWADLTEAKYLEVSPDMNMVDILGYDIYTGIPTAADENDVDSFIQNMNEINMIVNLAENNNKIPAITEAGFLFGYEEQLDTVNQNGGLHSGYSWDTIWSDCFFNPILNDPIGRRMAYIHFWGNSENQHYAPWPAGPGNADFNVIVDRADVLVNDEIPDMYTVH